VAGGRGRNPEVGLADMPRYQTRTAFSHFPKHHNTLTLLPMVTRSQQNFPINSLPDIGYRT
jgi:hypothetical protein